MKSFMIIALLYTGFIIYLSHAEKTPVTECWTMKEPPTGWMPAHIAEKHKRDVAELHVEPDALLCHRLDKDGLPVGEGELMGQWWRKK
jgi:hypothetical protein